MAKSSIGGCSISCPASFSPARATSNAGEEMLLKGVVDYVQKENQYSYDYAFRSLHRLERNRSIKILVAEDSVATRHFICNVLRSHLYQIHEAEDGEQALRILQKQADFDLLITDHSMPSLSGFELTKILRQKLKRHDLSIVGLSADSKGSLSAQFIKHGADDFLRKPFCPEELTCRVTSTLERREMLKALQRSAQIDSLTDLYNRHAFYEQAGQLLQATERTQRALSVAMLDLDLFKQINENYGHASGDAALVGFADLLHRAFGQTLIDHLGDEEFALLSPLPAQRLCTQLDQLRKRCASDAPAMRQRALRAKCPAAVLQRGHLSRPRRGPLHSPASGRFAPLSGQKTGPWAQLHDSGRTSQCRADRVRCPPLLHPQHKESA
jgi:diguanylate cyclase (GGDEF)-like protein